MSAWTDHRARARIARRVTGIWGFALLWVMGLSADVHADSVDDRWQVSVPAYLTARAFYQKTGEPSAAHESLTASVEVELSSEARPYSAGLFLDYGISRDPRYDGAVTVGGFFEYRLHNWDAISALVNNMSPGAPSQWLYAGRVRYRLAERHKVGIEAYSSLEESASPKFMLGYYGKISRTISVKFVADLNTNAGQGRAARTELVWRVN